MCCNLHLISQSVLHLESQQATSSCQAVSPEEQGTTVYAEWKVTRKPMWLKSSCPWVLCSLIACCACLLKQVIRWDHIKKLHELQDTEGLRASVHLSAKHWSLPSSSRLRSSKTAMAPVPFPGLLTFWTPIAQGHSISRHPPAKAPFLHRRRKCWQSLQGLCHSCCLQENLQS